jgi:hypothetical protein
MFITLVLDHFVIAQECSSFMTGTRIIMKSVFYSFVVLGYACHLIVTNLMTTFLNLNLTN